MVKKLRPKPEFDEDQSSGYIDYLSDMRTWALELEQHHIEETTELKNELDKVRKEYLDIKEAYSQCLYERALNNCIDD